MSDVPLLASVVRWGTFLALLITIGAAAFRIFVLGRLTATPSDLPSRYTIEGRAAAWGLGGALVLVPLALARLALQVAELRDPSEPWIDPARMMLFETTWGTGWWVQVGAALVGAAGFSIVCARQASKGGWGAATLGAMALAVTPALSGHAAGSPTWPVLAVVGDTLHVLGAGAWLGTLTILVATIVARRAAIDPAVVATAVQVFSPLALVSAAVVVASGVLASWLHVDRVSSLWMTQYGQRLLFKLGLFVLVLALGAFNWRRVTPRLGSVAGVTSLRAAARAELAVATLILLITAVLVATPLPGE